MKNVKMKTCKYWGKRKTMMKLLGISKRFKANYVKREVIRSYQIN